MQLTITLSNDKLNCNIIEKLENKIISLNNDITILRKSNELALNINKENMMAYDNLLERYNKLVFRTINKT
jgi:hypothetical protein